jgi:hypothetical protein
MKVEITDDMIVAFGDAWEEADYENTGEPGARRRAGLEAVLALVERQYHVLPKGHRPEGTELDLDAIILKWLQLCPSCDAGMAGGCTHPEEDYRPMVAELVAAVERYRHMTLQARTLDPLEQRGEGGWIMLVAWMMDRLGQRQVTIPAEAFEDDHRQLRFWQDFKRDGWTLEVSTAVDHIPPTTEDQP